MRRLSMGDVVAGSIVAFIVIAVLAGILGSMDTWMLITIAGLIIVGISGLKLAGSWSRPLVVKGASALCLLGAAALFGNGAHSYFVRANIEAEARAQKEAIHSRALKAVEKELSDQRILANYWDQVDTLVPQDEGAVVVCGKVNADAL